MDDWTFDCRCRNRSRNCRFSAGRIYRASVKVGTLTESGFERMRAEMEEG